MLDAILFDLDGTLLPMDQNAFLTRYIQEFSMKFADRLDPKKTAAALWEGSVAMVQNDGVMTNEARFWQVFVRLLGEKVLSMQDEFELFYANEFDRARAHTRQAPLAAQAVNAARKKAKKVVLATNPVFPFAAVKRRLFWAGLDARAFDFITTYENAHFCKPNPNYYLETLAAVGAQAENSLMIGNDVSEDALAAQKAGMAAYVLTDCLLGDVQRLGGIARGNFADMVQMLETLAE